MAEVHVEAGAGAVEQNGSAKVAAEFVSLKPRLTVPEQNAEEAVRFYKEAFGAEEVSKVCCPKRKADQELPSLLCSEIKIGSARLLVCSRSDDVDGPKTVGEGSSFQLETADVKAAVSMAVKAGAVVQGDLTENDCTGEGISGKLKDPFGYVWIIASPAKASDPDA